MKKANAWGIALLLVATSARADDDYAWFVVAGMMTESACMLEMDSASQQIALNTIPTSLLAHPGDRGAAVPLVLHLSYCVRTHGSISDRMTGSRSWDPIQPIVKLRFLAPGDGDNPQLVQVMGAKGIGLRISDARHNDVRLGEWSAPQFLTPGNSDLIFYVATERTPAPLVVGPYRAVVNFSLEYD